jgi:phage-related protein
MPQTAIRVFRNADKTIPLFEWLDQLEEEEPEAFARCLAVIQELERLGSELRRPNADVLRDGIHELRAHLDSVQYRILYFFTGQNVAVLSHGFLKDTAKVPEEEINLALERKRLVEQSGFKHLGTWRPIA